VNVIDSTRTKIESIFSPLNTVAAAKAFPPLATLSSHLEKLAPVRGIKSTVIPVPVETAKLFATASVEIWLRAVHSFLISASLTNVSDIWASAAGYYSSHYAVRAFAHVLGHFQLYNKKLIVQLDMVKGKYHCSFDAKHGNDREHKYYWKLVNNDANFSLNPLFRENKSDIDDSDVGHRDRANYADHIGRFPNFRPLELTSLVDRVRFISRIKFDTAPIPCKSRFPDIESVQIVAYHRIVHFRRFLDEVLGGKNRFWSVYRNPSWSGGVIDFQLSEQGGLAELEK